MQPSDSTPSSLLHHYNPSRPHPMTPSPTLSAHTTILQTKSKMAPRVHPPRATTSCSASHYPHTHTPSPTMHTGEHQYRYPHSFMACSSLRNRHGQQQVMSRHLPPS